MRNTLGISDDEVVLLFLGRISIEKSIEVLINQYAKLIERHNNTKLVIVGGGPDMEKFKMQVSSLRRARTEKIILWLVGLCSQKADSQISDFP